MMPLIDGAGYKLFDATMIPLTDGAGYKLVGTKMMPHLSLRRWGYFMEAPMIVSAGYFYHISDSYFTDVQDITLMSNKENGAYRPHFLAIQDGQNPDIYWMIPVSSRYEKYEEIYNRIIGKFGRCTKIVLGKCGGKDAAFLIQNAFPITADYIDHIHTSQGVPLVLHTTTAKTIVTCLQDNLRLHQRGIKLFYSDIDRLYQLMTEHASK